MSRQQPSSHGAGRVRHALPYALDWLTGHALERAPGRPRRPVVEACTSEPGRHYQASTDPHDGGGVPGAREARGEVVGRLRVAVQPAGQLRARPDDPNPAAPVSGWDRGRLWAVLDLYAN